ncbi:MAG: hypothetical protein ACR2K0_07320 [Acidimicrobiales bacterium]
MRRRTGGVAASVVAALVIVVGLAGCGAGPAEETTLARLPGVAPESAVPVLPEVAAVVVDEVTEAPSPATTAAPVVTTEPPRPAPATTTAPTTTAPAPPVVARPARAMPAGAGVYAGLGTWIDTYDWSRTFGKDGPLVEVGDIDRMADLGVQTLYVQTSRWNASADILEPERLLPLIARARARGMGVVAWYLPTFVDPATDLRRLLAAAELDVDAVAVDIESRDVANVAERNARLVQLSRDLRSARPGMALGGIVFPPVVMDVINTSFWPDFPWRELAPLYDVWLPMAYQSFRTDASGYREGYRYTAENIDRLRANLGLPGAVVHTVGGIADATTAADVDGMVAAAAERGAIGGSLYDWRTTSAGLWPHLRAFR